MQDREQQGRSHPPFSSQNFTQKARSAFLFYKFYKFRRKYVFIFNVLRAYRLHIRPIRLHIRPIQLHIRRKSNIDQLHNVAIICSHEKDHPSSRRSGS